MKQIKIMKKMTKQFFAAAVALLAFNACSDSYLSESDNVMPETDQATNVSTTVNSFVLTDANGQPVTTVSSNFGTYYLDIKANGLWYIETDNNMEFTPTRMCGRGSMRVPVLIGNNWAETRQLSYNVKFINETTKGITRGDDGDGDGDGDGGDNDNGGGDDDSDDTGKTVTQDSKTSLAEFKKIVNSNIFVGFGYNPAKNPVPELCTGIEIFQMDKLNDTTLVKSSLSPQAKESYEYATTEDDMDKLLSVKGNAGGNFNVVKFSLNADVNKTNTERHGTITVQKSLTRSVYSRELAWANTMLNDANFSDGFKYYKQRYINKLKNAAKDSAKMADATVEFFNIVGTHFISKALLGCQLDYRMTVDSTKTNKATSVKAALDFKWQQQVKDTTKVDSLEEEETKKTIPDSLRKNFVFGGKVSVTDSVYHASSSTKADVKARGGEIERVNILTTGGQLIADDLAKWLLATEPEKAVMVGINTLPIYVLFKDDIEGDEKDAHDYLQKLIDNYYSLDPSQYGDFLKQLDKTN